MLSFENIRDIYYVHFFLCRSWHYLVVVAKGMNCLTMMMTLFNFLLIFYKSLHFWLTSHNDELSHTKGMYIWMSCAALGYFFPSKKLETNTFLFKVFNGSSNFLHIKLFTRALHGKNCSLNKWMDSLKKNRRRHEAGGGCSYRRAVFSVPL